ncbi:hypothetical protein [Geothrix campi]|uniref:hypothetical protein n=1 Tax=Geothrix campi TaxID=2966450 RepID=UPI0021495BA7|nr:hypothetical protein [Geothrix sp. SG10]
MTYAETFNVQEWLEDDAKWLRWAMQSLTARNLEDVRYNLQQFWASLADAKLEASTPQDWGDILTLDSQSQWTLGNLYQNDQSDLLKQLNDMMLARNLVAPSLGSVVVMAAQYFNAETSGIRSQIQSLGTSAGAAFEAQKNLASQAQAAYRDAKTTTNQAGNSAAVAKTAASGNAGNTAFNLRQASAIEKPVSLMDFLKGDLFGLPTWAWLAGTAAIALLVLTGPTVVMANTAYRKATA